MKLLKDVRTVAGVVSRAGTSVGTDRRRQVELGQIQLARSSTRGMTAKARRRLIAEYHRRVSKGLPLVGG